MVRIRKAQRQVAGKDMPIKLVSGRGFPWTTLAEHGHLVPSCISNIRTEIPHVLMTVMLSSSWWKGEWTATAILDRIWNDDDAHAYDGHSTSSSVQRKPLDTYSRTTDATIAGISNHLTKLFQ